MWYKIADGPLDIVGKTLEVITATGDTPIIVSHWSSYGDETMHRAFGYTDDDDAGIYVLDNTILPGPWETNWPADQPLSGIFVTPNVRSIYIAEDEVVHKIDNKYIDLDVVPSVIFDIPDEYFPYSSYGYNSYEVQLGGNPTKLNMQLSNGYVIDGIEGERISYDGSNAGEAGYVAYDNEEEDWFVYPGSEEGKVFLLLKIYAFKEQDDDYSNMCRVTAFITIRTGGVD